MGACARVVCMHLNARRHAHIRVRTHAHVCTCTHSFTRMCAQAPTTPAWPARCATWPATTTRTPTCCSLCACPKAWCTWAKAWSPSTPTTRIDNCYQVRGGNCYQVRGDNCYQVRGGLYCRHACNHCTAPKHARASTAPLPSMRAQALHHSQACARKHCASIRRSMGSWDCVRIFTHAEAGHVSTTHGTPSSRSTCQSLCACLSQEHTRVCLNPARAMSTHAFA